ncbi:S1 family peptidase [Capillimicrobium parvum]|nr:trypsin-like serine protease [Capillimicrobium parvum]
MVPAAGAQAATPRYVGPQVPSAGDAPYSVLLLAGFSSRTGSILDESRILTAAHCVYDGGQVLPPNLFLVIAGTNQTVSPAPPAGTEFRSVASIRVHPAYNPATGGPGDVAILQLTRPLIVNGSVGPIPVTEVGASPALGSVVRGYGWGVQSTDGADDGYEHSLADMTVRAATDCAPGAAGIFCVQSPTGAACPGDSGGPIVSGAGLLVGTMSFRVNATCAAGNVDGIIDLGTPAIGLWVRGNDSPPPMPFTDKPATLAPPPLTGGAATCTGPAWSGSPTLTTVFFHVGDGAVVQSGPSTTYAPGKSDVGATIGCRSHAQTPGGTAEMAAAATIKVQAAPLSVRAAAKSATVSYGGPGDLPVKLVLSRGGHQAWSRTTAKRRVALPSRVKAGRRYRLCAAAPAAGPFAAAESCVRWRAPKAGR